MQFVKKLRQKSAEILQSIMTITAVESAVFFVLTVTGVSLGVIALALIVHVS